MIYYWNFVMAHEGTLSHRARYSLVDILGEPSTLRSQLRTLCINNAPFNFGSACVVSDDAIAPFLRSSRKDEKSGSKGMMHAIRVQAPVLEL